MPRSAAPNTHASTIRLMEMALMTRLSGRFALPGVQAVPVHGRRVARWGPCHRPERRVTAGGHDWTARREVIRWPRARRLVAGPRLQLLLELFLQPFQVEARALLHGREFQEGLGVRPHLLLDEHEAPEL